MDSTGGSYNAYNKKTKTTHKYIQNKIVHFELFGNIFWTNSDLC